MSMITSGRNLSRQGFFAFNKDDFQHSHGKLGKKRKAFRRSIKSAERNATRREINSQVHES